MPRSQLGGFVVRTFLWLPPCFALWVVCAPALAGVLGVVAGAMVDLLYPGLVTALERQESVLTFVTTIKVHPTPGATALLLPEVSALLYTYGLPLYAALALAARTKWWMLIVGALLLAPFQAWGIAFDFLSQVGIKMSPEITLQSGIYGAKREAIALGYQLGSLIFPTLAPVIVWAAGSRTFLAGLMTRHAAPATAIAPDCQAETSKADGSK
jgi:hypothetical protein